MTEWKKKLSKLMQLSIVPKHILDRISITEDFLSSSTEMLGAHHILFIGYCAFAQSVLQTNYDFVVTIWIDSKSLYLFLIKFLKIEVGHIYINFQSISTFITFM